MGLYRDRIVPHLIRHAMRQPALVPYRERVVAAAEGRVLELGVGSGMNLPYYGARVKLVIGVEPSVDLLSTAKRQSICPSLHLLRSSAEGLPLDADTVDTVVTTWTLCSIPDVDRALAEVRRVLRPSGRLLFVEHGLAPDPGVRRWQHRLTPIWKRLAGGCHLNRPIDDLIARAGFRIDTFHAAYMPGPRAMTFLYEGAARRA